MNRLILTTLLAVGLAMPGAAQAQSMNVRLITQHVMADICGPYARTLDIKAAIAAAEAHGYSVRTLYPDNRALATNPQAPPSGVELWGDHAGTIRIMRSWNTALCAVGIHEGGVASIAEVAEPHALALGLLPVLDEREGPTGIVVWRGEGRQVLISRSPRFTPGSELLVSIDAGPESED